MPSSGPKMFLPGYESLVLPKTPKGGPSRNVRRSPFLTACSCLSHDHVIVNTYLCDKLFYLFLAINRLIAHARRGIGQNQRP